MKHSYYPRKKASQLPVLMKLEGATPSQRKEFRAKEKVRHDELARVVGMGIESVLRRPLVSAVSWLAEMGRRMDCRSCVE